MVVARGWRRGDNGDREFFSLKYSLFTTLLVSGAWQSDSDIYR